MNKHTAVVPLTVLALAGLLGAFCCSSCKPGSSTNLKPLQALGEVAAEETAKLIGGSGQIVLIHADYGKAGNETQEAQMNSFRKAIKRQGRVSVAVTEKINLAPPGRNKKGEVQFFEPTAGPPPGLQPGQLGKIANSNAQAKAIVCFNALAPLTGIEAQDLRDRGVKLIVISEFQPYYKALFAAGVRHLAMVPRFEPLGTPVKPAQSTRDWFDQAYQMVTPERSAQLP